MGRIELLVMALSDMGILRCLEQKTIIIDPFNRANLSTSSYDVSLGEYFYRQTVPEPGQSVYSVWSAEDVARVWGEPQLAESMQDFCARTKTPPLKGIKPTDELIWIRPGETILAHTREYLGGRVNVTTMMKARSSMGRNFIEVCKCAGWGDTGYFNRWTMEITNNSLHFSIPLVVGRRIAQIIFFETEGTVDGASYEKQGKYQGGDDLEAVKKAWQPSAMLPKCYLDREAQEANSKAFKLL